MATVNKQALVSLTIAKPSDAREPTQPRLEVEIEDDCFISINLDEHQLALILGGTNLSVQAKVTRGSW